MSLIDLNEPTDKVICSKCNSPSNRLYCSMFLKNQYLICTNCGNIEYLGIDQIDNIINRTDNDNN